MSVPSDRKVAAARAADETAYEVTEFGRRPIKGASHPLWRAARRAGGWVAWPVRYLYRVVCRLLKPEDPAAAA
jgi:hypothetical protein